MKCRKNSCAANLYPGLWSGICISHSKSLTKVDFPVGTEISEEAYKGGGRSLEMAKYRDITHLPLAGRVVQLRTTTASRTQSIQVKPAT